MLLSIQTVCATLLSKGSKEHAVVIGVVNDHQPRSEAFNAQSRLEELFDVHLVIRKTWYAQTRSYLSVYLLETFPANCCHPQHSASRSLLPRPTHRLESKACLATPTEAEYRKPLATF